MSVLSSPCVYSVLRVLKRVSDAHGWWDWNSGLLQEQRVFLSAEPSLHQPDFLKNPAYHQSFLTGNRGTRARMVSAFAEHLCTVIRDAALLRKFSLQKLWYTEVARTVSWTLIAAQQISGVFVLSHPKPYNSHCTKDLSKTNISYSLHLTLSTYHLSVCLSIHQFVIHLST